MHKISLETPQGVLAYYKTREIPGAKVIFLLHGLSANHRTWMPVMERLSEQGYVAIAPDMRGHGESDKTVEHSRYSMAALAHDVGHILAHEKLPHAVFVGYSFGGSVLLEHAIEHPRTVEGLVLVSANHVQPLFYRWFGFMAPLLSRFLLVIGYVIVPFGPRTFTPYDPTMPGGYWASVWRGLHTMPFSVNAWLVSTGLSMDMRARISRITAPTLIVRAQSDPFFSNAEAEVMMKALPHAKLITLKTGHFIATEETDATTRIIMDFLKTSLVP